MLLYKHFKEEKYLRNWLKGDFTFTKLTVFQQKKKEEDHFIDHHEGSIIVPVRNEKLIFHNFHNFDLFSVSDKRIYKPIPEEKAKFVLISSFTTETNEKLRKEFGQYVLKFDFNKDLQELFSNAGILFRKVSYDDNIKMFSNISTSPILQTIESSYETLLLENRNLRNSVLFNKRPRYLDQKEFRFVIILNRDLVKKVCDDFFKALSGNNENYFPLTIRSDKIQSIKPFLNIWLDAD